MRRSIGKPLAGATLWELTATLAVLAVLAGAAAPSLRDLWRSAAQITTANAVVGALHFARSQAIVRAQPAVFCLSPDGAQCQSGSGSPARAWILFINRDGDAPPHRDSGEPLLRAMETPRGVRLAGTRAALTYWPVSRAGTTATIYVCPVEPAAAVRAVIVSQIGRPRVKILRSTPTQCQSGA